MSMTREDTAAKASAVIANNPHLDDIAEDTRRWLVTDIVNALMDAHLEGYKAGANDQAAKWTNTIGGRA